MNIVNTPTQADYDRLMEYLEEKGYKWTWGGENPTEWFPPSGLSEHDSVGIDKGNKELSMTIYKEKKTVDEYLNEVDPETERRYYAGFGGFKVGDKVKVINGCNGAHGADGKVGIITNDKMQCGINPSFIKVLIDDKVWGLGKDYELELVKEVHNSPEEDSEFYERKGRYGMVMFSTGTLPNPLFNKPNIKKMSIVKFAKNLTLSKNEKLMRKQGLKDENGVYTDAYTEIVDNIVYEEYEVKVLEIAKQAEEDEKKK